jgi:hypothetical protein
MNKMMLIPLGVMFFLTIIVNLYASSFETGVGDDYVPDGEFVVIGDGTEQTGEIDIPTSEPQEFDIWDSNGAMVILIAAMAIGILAGITVLGSGITILSQGMIFDGILFLGLWACLTLLSRELMFVNYVTGLLWVSLTSMYVIGLGSHMGRADG